MLRMQRTSLLVLDEIFIEAHGVDQFFLGRRREPGFDDAKQGTSPLRARGMSFP
jgi:hypothetical protein